MLKLTLWALSNFHFLQQQPVLWLGAGVFLAAVVVSWALYALLQPRVYLSAVKSLLTPAEMRFYQSLSIVASERWLILMKVRIADLLEVSSPQPASRQKVFRSIAAKHVDFVLADQENLEPQLILELDDSSHLRRDRRKRDIFVDQLFAAAGLPLIRVRAAQAYNHRELARRIEEALRSA